MTAKHAKRLIATKGEAQLITTKGEVYLYADALATTAHHVCSLALFRRKKQQLKEDGWTVL